MAGQPPDPPWQSPGLAGRDQVRTAWQPAQPPPPAQERPQEESHGDQQAAWQAQAYRRPPVKSKGFVASLFDFGFTSFVTPKVIKGLYILGTAWTALWAILLFLIGLRFGHASFGTFVFLFISIAVFVLLSLGAIRVSLEFFMALHRINENIQEMRDRERRS